VGRVRQDKNDRDDRARITPSVSRDITLAFFVATLMGSLIWLLPQIRR
jgi:hypothetical protein